MKRIAIVAYHHSESTLPLVKHLARQGCAVDYYFVTASGHSSAPALEFGRTVYVPGFRWRNARLMGGTFRYLDSEQVNVILAVLPPYARRLFGPYSRVLFFRLGRIVKRKRYDLVLIVGQDPFLLNLHEGLGRSGNVYHAVHEVAPHYTAQRIGHAVVDRLMESGTNLIVHSRAAERMLTERYGPALRNVTTIPFGVFESYLTYPPRDRELVGGRYFLFLGTLLPYKGLHVLQDAVGALGGALQDFRVVVAGAGSDPAIPKMEADHRFVVLRRYLRNDEVADLTKNAVCVVCPYTSASQSGIISTAFLFGKPIIASDVGGFGEFIESGRNGILTAPGDATSLAAAMRKIVDDPSLRERLARGAAGFALDARYAWDALARRYLELIV